MSTNRWSHSIIMFLGDGAVFFASLYVALLVRNLSLPLWYEYMEHVHAFLLLFVVYELVLYIAGFWGRQVIPTAKNIFELLVPAHVMATVIMLLYFYLLPSIGISPKTNLLIFSTALFVGMFGWKLVGLRLFTLYPIRAVLVGKEEQIKEIFESQPLWNIKITDHLSQHAGLEAIEYSLVKNNADTILVDLDRYPRIDIMYKLMFADISILDTVALREEVQSKIDLERIDQNWFLEHITRGGNAYRFLKRSIDVLAGLALALLSLILLPFIYLAITFDDGGPIFITQQRVGLRGREFSFYKFRTMHSNDNLWKSKNDKNKITRVGIWLRKTRIDEFAQCLNLIRGDISLVGPRAILVGEHQTMVKRNPFQQARLLAQPGLTGWAQVSQLHAPADEHEALERLAYDLYYIKNLSLWLDIQIMLKTVKKILQRVGMR